MAETRRCPICGEKAQSAFRISNADVFRCTDKCCGHFFASGLPDSTSIHSYETHQCVTRFTERNHRLIDLFLEKGILKERVHVLDVGSGEGHVARCFKERGFSVLCIEPSDEARAVLDSCGLRNAPYLSDISSDESFGFLCLVEVIEHLPDPVSTLRQALDHLEPGCGVFVSTPSATSLKARVDREQSNAFGVRTHLHYFTPRSLRLCMLKAGCGFVERWAIPFMIPDRSFTKRLLDRFLFRLGLEGGLTYVARKGQRQGFSGGPSLTS